ncbi:MULTISPECIES: hypothetical protein [Clostridia]|uniref:hypothetical protein n=1 Tax=Clostridia TaxID=186801 RepID=UPI002900991D|nr:MULTISPECIES: hypothetical protein [Clostridia]MDU0963623.1 hypothetical protein [Peptostreptococcus anaerobius]MDU0997511.1 hypothetical protein [Peptostreptococcus anaerobius]MDU1175706.1 hypothetical protein [Peptostreptococcus anaerobius]MDU1232166.1 hypothetical protein [Clostridium sp.]MDU1233623.1 hypothetical protein [Peptostreptococcus anaerobius]
MSKSRAEYMKKRREGKKAFSVLLDVDKFEAIDSYLTNKNKSKKEWLEEKIDNELKNEK